MVLVESWGEHCLAEEGTGLAANHLEGVVEDRYQEEGFGVD